MDVLGDMSVAVGLIGTVIYLCLIVIRFVTHAGKLKESIKGYDAQVLRLEEKLRSLKARHSEKDPEVNALLAALIDRRAKRDRLRQQYEEMEAKTRERQINIRAKTH